MVRTIFKTLRRHLRRRRYQKINRLLALDALAGPILDLGGGPASFFTAIFPRREQVILLDLCTSAVRMARQRYPGLMAVVADGGRLPFTNASIAATICNSVIEHVHDPVAFAAEVRRVSQRYFIQTPNGAFPLETHSLIAIPCYNLIPWRRLRRLLCRIFGADFAYIESVRYLTEPQLRQLFPEAKLEYEMIAGLKKSFYLHHCREE